VWRLGISEAGQEGLPIVRISLAVVGVGGISGAGRIWNYETPPTRCFKSARTSRKKLDSSRYRDLENPAAEAGRVLATAVTGRFLSCSACYDDRCVAWKSGCAMKTSARITSAGA